MSELKPIVKKTIKRDLDWLEVADKHMQKFYDDIDIQEYKSYSIGKLLSIIQSSSRNSEEHGDAYIVLFHRVVQLFQPFLIQQHIVPFASIKAVDKSLNEKVKLKFISEGAYGRVFSLKIKGFHKQMLIVKVTKNETEYVDALHETVVNALLSVTNSVVFRHVPKFFSPAFLAGVRKQDPVFMNRNHHMCILQEQFSNTITLSKFILANAHKQNPSFEMHLETIFLQILCVLAAAQRACKFVHYDLHTSNILIEEHPEQSLHAKYELILRNKQKMDFELDYTYHAIMIDFGMSVAWRSVYKHGFNPLFILVDSIRF